MSRREGSRAVEQPLDPRPAVHDHLGDQQRVPWAEALVRGDGKRVKCLHPGGLSLLEDVPGTIVGVLYQDLAGCRRSRAFPLVGRREEASRVRGERHYLVVVYHRGRAVLRQRFPRRRYRVSVRRPRWPPAATGRDRKYRHEDDAAEGGCPHSWQRILLRLT